MIIEHPFQRKDVARGLREQTAVIELGVIVERLTSAKAVGSQSDETVEARGEEIVSATSLLAKGTLALETDRKPIFLPRSIEQRNRSMVEEVEKLRQ